MSGPAKSIRSTRVVELTPRGRGALAVVLVAGPDGAHAVGSRFHAASGQPLARQPIDQIALGRWGGPKGEELVVCRRADDRVEIHCHGGAAAVRAVIDDMVRLGCESIDWQDWLRHTEDDPVRAAAQLALADAPTARTAAILLDQCHGALSAAIRATLDAALADQWREAAAGIDALLVYGDLGQHLVQPWRVVLAGRPNVGKSSLINALVGYQRAIVCDLPGTTRDVVTATTAIDGWPVQLADTAGLGGGRADNEIEATAFARAGAALAEADLVLAVHDAAAPQGDAWVEQSGGGVCRLPPKARRLRVRNKIDLVMPLPAAGTGQTVLTSALTGQGIDALVAAVSRTLVPLAPPAGAAVPFTAQQFSRLTAARAATDRRDIATIRRSLQPLLPGSDFPWIAAQPVKLGRPTEARR